MPFGRWERHPPALAGDIADSPTRAWIVAWEGERPKKDIFYIRKRCHASILFLVFYVSLRKLKITQYDN